MIYKIDIYQYFDGGFHNNCYECYDSVETLRKAFESLNSEYMFGNLLYSNITPDWETDCFSEVRRKRGNCLTVINSTCLNPITKQRLELCGAFSTERGMGFLKTF